MMVSRFLDSLRDDNCFWRSGVSSQAFLTNEVFLKCYSKQAPTEDSLHCVAQNASLVSPQRNCSKYGEWLIEKRSFVTEEDMKKP